MRDKLLLSDFFKDEYYRGEDMVIFRSVRERVVMAKIFHWVFLYFLSGVIVIKILTDTRYHCS